MELYYLTLIAVIAIVFIYVMIKGIVIVVQKNFWLAILMLIVFAPLFFIWAFFEGIFYKTNETEEGTK